MSLAVSRWLPMLVLAVVAVLDAWAEPTAKPEPPAEASQSQPAAFRRLQDRLTLREPFNAARGKIRVVAFLSPTCPLCLAGVADIRRRFLSQNDSDDFRIFIVWLKVNEDDSEKTVPAAIAQITDKRVQHFWDPDRILNGQLVDAVMFDIHMRIFDVYLLYDREATWEKRLPRPGFFLHQVKGLEGPPWDIDVFVSEMTAALAGKPFSRMF